MDLVRGRVGMVAEMNYTVYEYPHQFRQGLRHVFQGVTKKQESLPTINKEFAGHRLVPVSRWVCRCRISACHTPYTAILPWNPPRV